MIWNFNIWIGNRVTRSILKIKLNLLFYSFIIFLLHRTQSSIQSVKLKKKKIHQQNLFEIPKGDPKAIQINSKHNPAFRLNIQDNRA